MHELLVMASLAAAIMMVNVPCGYWRAGVRKFSVPWFLAVHAPVPLVFLLRTWAGVSWSLATLPLLAGAYFGGQLVGARFRRNRRRRAP